MGSFRTPGPVCATRAGGDDAPSPGGPPAPAAAYQQPGALDESALAPDEGELADELLRLVHELLRLPPPPPYSPGRNLRAAWHRPELLRAERASVSLVPALSDLVRTGQLGRSTRALARIAQVVGRNGALADQWRPVLARVKEILDLIPVETLSPKVRGAVEQLRQPIEACLGGLRGYRRVWWEVLQESPERIAGSSIPDWILLRVGRRRFRVERRAEKAGRDGRPIGPATKHLAEQGLDDPARDFARMGGRQALVDFPMSSLAAGLEAADQLLTAGRVNSGEVFTVEAWELGINTRTEPWVVYHAVYKPRL